MAGRGQKKTEVEGYVARIEAGREKREEDEGVTANRVGLAERTDGSKEKGREQERGKTGRQGERE